MLKIVLTQSKRLGKLRFPPPPLSANIEYFVRLLQIKEKLNMLKTNKQKPASVVRLELNPGLHSKGLCISSVGEYFL